MTRDEWIAEFRTKLMLDLRPEFGDKLARTVAASEWPQAQAPGAACCGAAMGGAGEAGEAANLRKIVALDVETACTP